MVLRCVCFCTRWSSNVFVTQGVMLLVLSTAPETMQLMLAVHAFLQGWSQAGCYAVSAAALG